MMAAESGKNEAKNGANAKKAGRSNQHFLLMSIRS
jgi:hypothetical protein